MRRSVVDGVRADDGRIDARNAVRIAYSLRNLDRLGVRDTEVAEELDKILFGLRFKVERETRPSLLYCDLILVVERHLCGRAALRADGRNDCVLREIVEVREPRPGSVFYSSGGHRAVSR